MRAYAIEVGLDPDQTVQAFVTEYEQYLKDAADRAPRPEVTEEDREFLARQQRAARWLRAVLVILL